MRIQNLIDDTNGTFYTHSNLGPQIVYTFIVRNKGPSPILSSQLIINWPLGIRNPSDLNDLTIRDYFLYITTLDSANIQCDQTYINIRNIQTDTAIIDENGDIVPLGRRRRDANLETGALHRNVRQTSIAESDVPTNITFDTLRDAYVNIACGIGRLAGGSEYELQIQTRVFEPTLVIHSPDDTWRFTVNVTGLIVDTHARQAENHLPDTASVVVTVVPSQIFGVAEPFTLWWVIIVAVVVFIALLIPLFCILYFAGFFRKSKTKKARENLAKKLEDWNQKGNSKPDF